MSVINEPKSMEEIYKIREITYNKTERMTPAQTTARRKLVVEETIRKYNLKIKSESKR